MKLESLKGTGRTTRMLGEAKALARQGRAVYVIAATREHAKMLERIAGEEGQQLGIKFETAGSHGNFDWMTMRLTTAHPNCVVLADHYAIEVHFRAALEMLHRFDGESLSNGSIRPPARPGPPPRRLL